MLAEIYNNGFVLRIQNESAFLSHFEAAQYTIITKIIVSCQHAENMDSGALKIHKEMM